MGTATAFAKMMWRGLQWSEKFVEAKIPYEVEWSGFWYRRYGAGKVPRDGVPLATASALKLAA
jgi:hypothetical protein